MIKLNLRLLLTVVFIAIAIMPVLFLGGWVQVTTLQKEIDSVSEKHLLIARNITAAFERYVNDTQAAFAFFTEEALHQERPAGMSALAINLGFRCFAIVDQTGKTLFFLPNTDQQATKILPEKLLKQLSQTTQDPSGQFSEVMADSLGNPTLFLTRRLDGDRFAVGTLSMDYLVKMQKTIKFGKKGHAAIVDQQGQILAHPNKTWIREMKNISNVGPVARMIAGETGISQFYSPAVKKDMISGFTTVSETGWGVMVPQPMEELEEKANAVRMQVIAIIVAGLVVAGLISWWVSGLLIRPLNSFNEAAQDFGQKKWETRVSMKERVLPVEFQKLSDTFNVMAREIQTGHEELSTMQLNLEKKVAERTREVEERKKIEEKLRESEEEFRTLTHTATDAIVSLDDQGHISIWNEAATRIFGFTEQEAIGSDIHSLILPDQYRERAYQALKKLFETGTSPLIGQTLELIAKRKDGDQFPVELSISSMKKGEAWHATGIIRDITERKKMEEELLKAQKIESLGVLAGGIAHDFNNILTSILGNVSLAKTYLSPQDEVFERLAATEKASLRAKALTQQLLTFSRGGTPIKKTICITDSLKESADFILRGANVQCEFVVTEEIWSVEIDEGQIGQVINNLIINASQAMPDGGSIRIHLENVRVGGQDELPFKNGEYVKISIEDQGSGIPQEHLSKIFDPYFSTKKQGNGLGLTVSYSIIKKHNGHIAVESELGSGTTFTLYLPASHKLPLTVPEVEVEVGPLKNKGHVLVMDDEEIVRNVTEKVIGQLHYEAAFAEDGVEAVELYKKAKSSEHPFDAVILDLTVPGGMGGVETLQKLLEIDPQVKSIVSSGYSNDPVMSNFEQYGFNAILAKPYTIQELAKVLQEVIVRFS